MSLVGVVTAVTCERAGVLEPMAKELTERLLLVLLLLSVTAMVQLEYVPSSNAVELSDCVRVTVLFPDITEDEDELPQDPPYEIVPASVEEKV